MPDADAWQAFGGIVVVLIFLGSGVVALKRLGLLGAKPAATAPANGGGAKQSGDNAVSTQTSELADIQASLTDISERLARVETKLESRSVDHLWAEHKKVADMAGQTRTDVARIDGVMTELRPLIRSIDQYLRSRQGGAE